ncbi:hypothetical protein [Clostridium frigidicarnis]|uniref:Uncharacterized protein n=1 Tax=Clostridium frigidicarnis TaxID=84698 RepID=A0A1I0ZYY8_9CLOT|nr:hypothetical protein [Clostridium frigidicarnis]SFB30276.1 hypothetical protein SAMN04488528_10274 [Clostridium frigidicarnis]
MDRRKRLIESIVHSVIIMILWVVITNLLLTKAKNIYLLLFIGILGLIYSILYIKKPYKKDALILNSWIELITVVSLGILIGQAIKLSNIVGIIIGISVYDVVSFTKKGKKTLNAKVMNNKNLMAKFIVYGVSLKDRSPVPTKGVGDFFFYTIIASGVYKFLDPVIAINSLIMIFIGCLINYLIVCHIYNEPGYKGLPATPIPFALVLGMIMVHFI